ncbi:MAG: alpha/beta hydrolase, partial [Lachnospiraceae bacterium]|nr:alpha/beta hydrolase [Lachnospiraceae bacterium]
ENMPIVVVFHGYGDTNNLLTYRTAVEWAEPDNQALRPCYVLAPVIDDTTYYSASGRDKVFEDIYEILNQMIADGKVDSTKIYIMGNSFGGLSTFEFCEKYPDMVAGALALCPALPYSTHVASRFEDMKDVPIWICHASGDNTIPVTASQNAVKKLEALSATEVHYTEYTDEEMNSFGASSDPDATYSYHHVELAVMETDSYMEWLFSKEK